MHLKKQKNVMINLLGKKIGIWGFGVVGKSLINHFSSKKINLSVIEQRDLTLKEFDLLHEKNIKIYKQQNEIENFFNENDFIIPSPGVDLRPFAQYNYKILNELDIFFTEFKKPIYAVTGSVGKTTVTTILAQLFQLCGKNFIAAGNIGIGMCDLISMQDIDGVILELSSFQLEHCKIFKPEIAVMTNFYPNHLDRHTDLNSYFEAKSKIWFYQNHLQSCLLPLDIIDKIEIDKFTSSVNFFSLKKPSDLHLKKLSKFNNIFFIENNFIVKMSNTFETELIINTSLLSSEIFIENWLIICATLFLAKQNLNNLVLDNLTFIEHRVEKFATFNGIDFYNDSKSTIPEATLAAVNKLSDRPIILLLGGISKGIDRSTLIKNLKDKVKYIICFGLESENLKNFCLSNNIPVMAFEQLENAVSFAFSIALQNDQILFSPSGASFDLFSNYQERGKAFKKIVFNLIQNKEDLTNNRLL